MSTRILIVEDEGLIALDLKKKLEQAGDTVAGIEDNAEDALRSAERLRPALVLMDIRLSGPRDGIETADLIGRQFHIPVMFVTAHADRETLERAKITEPFGYIVKPFHGIDFRAQIEIALWKHKIEQRLRASEAWLSTTVNNVADALIATDSEGNIFLMNALAASLTGWEREEARGKPLLDVWPVFEEESDLPVVHPIHALYEGVDPGSDPRTYRLMKRGGTDSTLVEAGLSANHHDGELLGVIIVFRDVTERRRAEEQNRQLQKMNALALMAVGLGRELAESQNRIDESVKRLIAISGGCAVGLLGDIYTRTAYHQSVIQKLMLLGRTDAGQPVLLDLNQILTDSQGRFRKALGTRRSLTLDLEQGLPPINADCRELQENLLRLVMDARRAMPDGGTVDMSSASSESADGKQWVQLAIRDSGRGLRGAAKERVFDPYYQSRSGSKNPGFSLALMYRFMALAGGSIDVDSAPGKGTGYLLTFPAAVRFPTRKSAEHQSLAAGA